MARTKVIEPATGVAIEVESDSPLAKLWATAEKPAKKAPAKKAAPAKKSEK